jgi:hypothetical protein
LNQIPAFFPYASEIGALVDNVAAATVASFVFFMISIQIPLVEERRHVGRSIMQLAERVSTDTLEVWSSAEGKLRRAAGERIVAIDPETLTEENIVEQFKKLAPEGDSHLVNTYTNARLSWAEALLANRNDAVRRIEQIWKYSRFLDADLARLLDDIQYSLFAETVESWRRLIISHRENELGSLEPIASAYFDWMERGLALRRYCAKYRVAYGVPVDTAPIREGAHRN